MIKNRVKNVGWLLLVPALLGLTLFYMGILLVGLMITGVCSLFIKER